MHARVLFEDISVTIFKEGDRSLQVKIPVRIHAAHAQSAWVPFLNHVKHELELEDIEGIYDDVDGAPVIRAASLIDGGLYFARPTEVSAMLRSLVRTEQERYPAWPSIEKGLEAKRELERCREYYEQQLLPMSLTTRENKAVHVEASPHGGDSIAELWAMKVKQGFKCRVYKTPACRPNEVVDVLPMGTIVTLSTDWGEAMEKHPQRGKNGKGKVLWMVEPQEGFLERRPLEDLQAKGGDDAVKAEAAAPPPHAAAAAAAVTPEERMGVVRGATKMSELLRSTLRRGAYFEGAAGVHSFVEVHRAALRAAATLMRKDPASREGLLECRGIDLFVLIVNKFCEEDRLLCEYGCWAFAVFAGEGDSDSDPSVFRFQEALAEAGGLAAVGCAVDAHRDSAQLRRYGVSALAAIVHENASTAGKLHSLNLHAKVAEDSIRRWPNDPELSCLACWVLRSVVEPSSRSPKQGDPEPGDKGDLVLHGGIGGDGGSVVGSKFRMRRRSVEEAKVGSMMTENSRESSLQKRNGGGLEGDNHLALESGDDPGDEPGDADETGGGGGGVVMEGSTMSGSVFGMGDNETSDLLISLADDDDIDEATTATGRKPESPFGQPGSVSPAASTTAAAAPVSAITDSSTANQVQGLQGVQANQNQGLGGVPVKEGRRDIPKERLGGDVHAGPPAISSESPRAGAPNGGGTREVGEGHVVGQAGDDTAAAFEGVEDGEVLERLLKLAEATKVLNHDNEDTRKAASRLVGAILRQIDSTYVRSSRRRRRASQARVARVLREGQAIGAL
ncbi:unnamed protein product [Ectocarpus fasciculatus]